MSIKIPVSAQFDAADVKKQIQMINDQIKVLGHTVAQAQKLKFEPISVKSKEDMSGLLKQMQQMLKVQTELKQRLASTGQGNVNPLMADWSKMYPNMGERLLKQRRMLSFLGNEFNRDFTRPEGATGSGVRPPRPPVPPTPSFGSANTGGGGSGPSIPGMGMASFMGNIGAKIAYRAFEEIIKRIGDSQTLSITTDRILRQSGVLTNFDSTRKLFYSGANALGMPVNQFADYATQYQRQAGYRGDANDLTRTATLVGQFGRGYGLEPQEAMGAFAGAQRVGVATDDMQIRKLGLLLGEGVGKSHAFSSMDKFSSVVGSYITQTARETMTAPNMTGYVSALSALVNSGPGADVEGSAAALSQIDAAIKHGGNAGEAGTNFNARVATRNHLNALQMMMLQSGGAFATTGSTMGAGSDYAKLMGGSLSGNKTALQMTIEELNSEYKSPSMRIMAISKYMGVNPLIAAKIANLRPAEMGQTSSALSRYGIDTSKIDMSAIPELVKVNGTGRAGAMSVATGLISGGKLSNNEIKRLSDAMKTGSDDELKKITSQLVAAHGQTETEGSQTRKSIAEVSNAIQKQTDILMEPINMMRMALVKISGGTEKDIEDNYWAAKEKDARAASDAKYSGDMIAARERNNNAWTHMGSGDMAASSANLEDVNRQRQQSSDWAAGVVAVERMRANTDPSIYSKINKQKVTSAQWSRLDKMRPLVDAAALRHHVDPMLLMAMMLQESGANPDQGINDAGARGVLQVTERANLTHQNLSTLPGNIEAGAAYLADRQKKFGYTAGIASYNAGSPGNINNSQTQYYLPAVENYRNQVQQHYSVKIDSESIDAIGTNIATKVHSKPLKTESDNRSHPAPSQHGGFNLYNAQVR